MSPYAATLHATKAHYPFQDWISDELEGYTPEACEAYAQVFNELIDTLAQLGPDATETEKLAAFEEAILATNELNDDDGLIETGEREDLCELSNRIATAAGLDPTRYGDGEGPASEWRDW